VNPITNAEKVKTQTHFQSKACGAQKFAKAIDFSGCVLYDFFQVLTARGTTYD
jgi:hypothetical protein